MASCVSKEKPTRFLPATSAGHHRLHVLARHVNTGSPARKDALHQKRDKSEEMQTIDLDKWKSIMRSQAASEEKPQASDGDEASDEDDENLSEPGGDSLQATRDLVAMWREAGKLVPQEMTDEEVQLLATLTTKSARKKHLKYLALREQHKKIRKEKQEQKRVIKEALMKERRAEQGDDKSLMKSTFLLQFWSRSLDRVLGWKSAQAMVFGQPLVFDMSYEMNMSRRELENTVSQMMDVEGFNRRATEPYHLHFCNLQPDSAYKQEFLKRYGEEAWDRLLITATDRQHIDLFPREQLVYLTADSPKVLRKFDPSKVYIIGALVDRSVQTGLSLANAKRLNLATARLPLDEFLQWEIGAKNLTLDQMVQIMITLKDKGSWEEALQFVPKRKHDGFHKIQDRNKGVRNHGSKKDGAGYLKSGERSFEKESTRLSWSHRQSGSTGGDMAARPRDRQNIPAATRVRTSSHVEDRGSASRKKMWWNDE